jgi:hypothetical protein
MLVFAHLSEPREGEEDQDPQSEVARQARQVLGDQIGGFQDVRVDSAHAVPREGEITFLPTVPGVQFNPPSRTFLWQETVHREEFRLRADPSLDGQTARGRLTVFLGTIILADIALNIRVDSAHRPMSRQEDIAGAHARPYRMIFASYSHKDTGIVEEFERHVERSALGDRYLRDCRELRAGEVWNSRLMDLIEHANVFQLFWSNNSMTSPFVRQEWEHALSLGRPYFVRPVYWEEPMPCTTDGMLPPQALRELHFQQVSFDRARPLASSKATDPSIMQAVVGVLESQAANAMTVGNAFSDVHTKAKGEDIAAACEQYSRSDVTSDWRLRCLAYLSAAAGSPYTKDHGARIMDVIDHALDSGESVDHTSYAASVGLGVRVAPSTRFSFLFRALQCSALHTSAYQRLLPAIAQITPGSERQKVAAFVSELFVQHTDYGLRVGALNLIENFGYRQALPMLREVLSINTDPFILRLIVQVFLSWNDTSSAPQLMELLDLTNDPSLAGLVIQALKQFGCDDAIPKIEAMIAVSGVEKARVLDAGLKGWK